MHKKFLVLFALSLLIAIGLNSGFAIAGDEKPAAGTPLPAGGGEPGKAYVAYCKAITASDMAALKKLVSAERAKSMDSPDFAKMFPMIQSMMAKDIKITGGTMTATTATLNAEGKDSMGGGVTKGTISMVLEDKQWKVTEDSWKSEMK